MAYEVINSELKYKGRIVDVRFDEITLPDGRAALREVIVRGSAAAVVPVGRNGEITLVRQYRHGAGRMLLEIPAGMVEDGEDVMVCAVRELEEETGLIAGKIEKLLDFHVSAGYCTEVISIYMATELSQGMRNLDPDEFLDIEEYSLDELTDMFMRGELTDSKTIIGLFAVKERFGR